MITVTYTAIEATNKGRAGFRPVVNGKPYGGLFYRSRSAALNSAEMMANATARDIRQNGHKVTVTEEKGA